MANIQTPGDISVFGVDGVSILCNHNNATFSSTTTMLDGSCIGRDGMDQQPVGATGQIEFEVLLNKSGYNRLIASDVSFSLSSVDYNAAWTSIDLDLTYKTVSQKGARDYNARSQPIRKGYSGNVSLNLFAGTAKPILTAAYSKVAADKSTAFNLAIDSTVIAIPAKIASAKLNYERDGAQNLSITIEGSDPGTGAYPTTPTSGSGLLSKAFINWKDPIAFAFQSHSTLADGVRLEGSMTFNSVKISSKGDDFVRVAYVFDAYGDVAVS